MAYDNYSVKKVFSNELVNIHCNKLFDAVHVAFPGSETKILAEGDLSRMIQGMAKISLPVVQLVTNDAAIYSYLVKNLQAILSVETQLSFTNRIQFTTSQAFFEIWMDAAATSVNVDGLYCRDLGGSYPAPVPPYNILLLEEQVFTEVAQNELYYKDWSANIEAPVKVVSLVGAASPAPIPVDVQVENVFLSQPDGKYSGFKIQTRVANWVSSSNTANYGIVSLTGDVNVSYPGDDLLEAELLRSITTNFSILGYVEPGTFSWDLLIEVHGVRNDSGFIDRSISSYKIPFSLLVLAEDEISASLDHIVLTHVRNELPLAGQEIEVVTGSNFAFTLLNIFEVTGGNVIEQAPVYNRRVYHGSGSQVLTVKATAALDATTGSTFSGSFQFGTLSSSGGRIRNRQYFNGIVTAHIFEEHGIFVDPEALEFFAIKGIEAAAAQELAVVSTQTFTVEHPFWLQVFPLSGENFKTLKVQPINAANLVSGEYFGNIVITSASAQVEVPVTLTVVESIDEGFSSENLNFTHDNKKFTYMYSDNAANRASCNLKVNAYNFRGFPSLTELNFKGTFFNNRFKIHLGDIVARRFAALEAPSKIGIKHYNLNEDQYPLFKIYKYYRPASANISLDIEERATGTVEENENFEDVLFVRGRRPKKFSDDYGILNFEAGPVRVTENSQMLFNFVRRFSQHEIKIYRNNALFKTLPHSPGNDSLFGLAMFFRDFRQGDVIDVRLADVHVQQYLMFPTQQHSHHLVFMNEYNVPEAFEFTGEYEFFTDKKVTSAKRYHNLVEHIENLETGKEQRFRINTGWILRSNQIIVDAITDAQHVWLVHHGREISLRPVDVKMSNHDSTRDLYQYDVEFIINRENELEVYSL
ncbi:hypothetical protein VS868_12090 [Salinimicrobium sp. 3283s]|uniref:hypothetical protein n=1 Tax=Salinimicrobium sp. 3283s TaxID=3114359 RepID=UPI0031EDF07E